MMRNIARTCRRVLVIMKLPLVTPSGKSGALTEAPEKEWLQLRLQHESENITKHVMNFPLSL